MTGARKPGPREEHEGNRKTIVQGMPSCFGVPVVTKACVLSFFAHKAAGAAKAPGIPCALFFKGGWFNDSGAFAPRECKLM